MRKLMLIATLIATTTAAGAAQAQSITIANAWSRATTASAQTGVVYATITGSGAPDRLLTASSPVAGRVELHETVKVGNVMKMQSVEALVVTPGKPVTLSPGGYHLMLMQLKHKLTQGESFPLTLEFEKSGKVNAMVQVQGPGATSMGTGHGGMHMAPATPVRP